MYSDLKFVLILYAAAVMCYGSVNANSYRALNSAVQRIDGLMVAQANYFNFKLANAPMTYFDRAAFVVENLRKKAVQIDELDNLVYNKCVAYGIDVFGLEFVGTRLERLLNYLDERDQHQKNEVKKSYLEVETCGHRVYELEQKLHEVNSSLGQTIGKQNVKITALETERDKLLAKVNKNAPAIHGRTGIISGVENSTNAGNHSMESGESKKRVVFVGFPELNQQSTEATLANSEQSKVPLNASSSTSTVANHEIATNVSSIANSECENINTLKQIIEDKGNEYGVRFRNSEELSNRLQKLITYFENKEKHQSEIIKNLRENLNKYE